MELGISTKDLKKVCTPEPFHPDMQKVVKTFLNEGRGILVHFLWSQIQTHFGDLSLPLREATLERGRAVSIAKVF